MIRKLIKSITPFVANLFSLDLLRKKSNHHIILPFYHAVTDEYPIHIKNLYEPRSIEQFVADLDFLLEHYRSISLPELIEINKSDKTITENCFHLTFDDGLKEFYTIVAPILKEKGVHATVFLNSDFIDNKELFYRFKASILFEETGNDEVLKFGYSEQQVLDELAEELGIDFNIYLKQKQPYLTSEQINDLIGAGFTFGAHGKDHPLYKELGLEEQITQTKESLEIIKTKFNLEYSVFSFPFTDDGVSQQLFDAIKNYSDLTFGCAGIKEDSASNHLQRIPMETAQTGKEIIKFEYLYCLIKQIAGKNKIIRQ